MALPRLIAIATLVTVSTPGCRSRSEGARGTLDGLYALDAVGEIRIELSEAASQGLSQRPAEWVEATTTVLGQRVERVAVRIKGHRSRRPLADKPALKLSFDRLVPQRKVHGVTELTLNNMVDDPTMMREFLGYRLYRAAGVAAPRVGYVNVVINSELRGLYALIESPDEVFLSDRFPGKLGKLYEGEYGCDIYAADVDGLDRDFGSKGRKKLRALAETAERGADALFYAPDHPIDTKAFLSYLAVSAFIADFDGYRHAHNYRIYYQPKTEKWHFLPWGIDRSFKRDLDIYDSSGLAARLCFENARCRLDYLRTLSEVTDKFAALDFGAGVDVVAAVTREHVDRDPKRPYSASKVHDMRKQLREFVAARPRAIRAQLGCLKEGGERDDDGDGFGCLDCNDGDASIHPGAIDACSDGIDNDCSGVADDAPSCACATLSLDDATFELCEIPMSWAEAQAHCQAKGKNLAKIDSAEQSSALYKAVQAHRADRWWIGLNDRDQEGTFVWADGQALTAAYWNQPPDNGSCNQDCVALHDGHNGKWHDTHCGQRRPFICR